MALEFSAQTPEVQKNFPEIFTKSFLAEFFDYEYQSAAKLAYELSRDYKGDPVQAREDFLDIVHYCKDGKTLDLPTKLCADLSIRLAHLSQYYPDGVRKPFHKLYSDLREKKEFALDMKNGARHFLQRAQERAAGARKFLLRLSNTPPARMV